MKNTVYSDALKISGIVFLLGIAEFLILSLCLSFRTDIILGVLYGCIFASLNFFYLAYSVQKSLDKSGKKAQMHMAASYNMRLFLTAAMVVIAVKVDFLHLWSALIPLIFPRIAVHMVGTAHAFKSKGSEKS